ncbi:MAG: multidrug effflux MFS transporter [Anaerolineales bacterium]|nr:multidrug effflux MFS transporter [Anaerolineales bacterium]
MQHTTTKNTMRFGEFVALMAMMMSLVALSIDALLPALPEIGASLGVEQANDNQLIISMLFLGLSIGQMFYGPLSDSIGRKTTIYIGLVIFMAGCTLALTATSFTMMLVARVIQGIGAAGPRTITLAVVRDQYDGRRMARVMSFVMTVFILVPVVAPSIGQAVLLFAHWRAIFGMYLVLSIIALAWFGTRQPETLPTAKRIPFSGGRIMRALREIFANRIALGYTVMAGLVSGAFVGYLNSAQQIFQDQYGLGQLFPLYFSVLALALGSASFLNARLVMRYGMRTLVLRSLLLITLLSIVFAAVVFTLAGQPPLWLLMGFFLITFFGVGILFGNLNALAMEPLGHIAGVGAAVVGSLSTLLSSLLGTVIGQNYNGTVLPLIFSFGILSALSLVVMRWSENGLNDEIVKNEG